jgi:uncharacterized phage protein (TIGR02218 family)
MRTVPAELQDHLDGVSTTTCHLLKITTVEGVVLGFTTLDKAIEYDDGAGSVRYSAMAGTDLSALRSDLGYSVDNAEGRVLVSEDVQEGLSIEEIQSGALDEAQWKLYVVNFEDLTTGRHVLLDAGDIGQVRVKHGLVWMPELLSYLVRLRQPVGSVDSITCRAIFGSPANSQTGCGIDADALWVNGEVTAVGAETDRVFEADIDPGLTNTPPGRVQWLTGNNASSRLTWVEALDGNEVTLGEPTRWPIEVGDTFRIRPDCGKWYERDCIGIWNNGLNFKGEPHIPVGDAGQIQTPGAQLPGGGGFQGTTPPDE